MTPTTNFASPITVPGPVRTPFTDDAARRYVAPQGQLEAAIAAIWQDLLGQSHIGRQSDFFELGGHSALAVQLVHRVRQSLHADIGMLTLRREPVLHRFAQLVAASTGLAHGGPACLSG